MQIETADERHEIVQLIGDRVVELEGKCVNIEVTKGAWHGINDPIDSVAAGNDIAQLLVTPQSRLPQPRLPQSLRPGGLRSQSLRPDGRAVRRTARRVQRGTESALDSLKGKVLEAVTASLAQAWKGAK